MLRNARSHIKKEPARSIIKDSATYVVPVLEAVHSAADVFPPLKSAAGGALWIAQLLEDFKSSGKDEKEFADYLRENVARVIASVTANGDLASLEPLVQALNDIIEAIQEDILHWQSQPSLKRFGRIIKNRQPVQKYRARLDEALQVFNLGSIVLSHKELFKIISTLQNIQSMADGVQHGLSKLENDLGRVTSTADVTKARVGTLRRDVAGMRKDLDGLATINHVHRLEIQMNRVSTSILLVCGVFLD